MKYQRYAILLQVLVVRYIRMISILQNATGIRISNVNEYSPLSASSRPCSGYESLSESQMQGLMAQDSETIKAVRKRPSYKEEKRRQRKLRMVERHRKISRSPFRAMSRNSSFYAIKRDFAFAANTLGWRLDVLMEAVSLLNYYIEFIC